MKYLILLLLLIPVLVNGQNFPLKPKNYVTRFDPSYSKNFALTQQEEDLLNAKLRAFEESTGIQLFIYITLHGPIKAKETLAQQIFNAWGIGQKDKDNGALIAIFTSDQEFVVVGRGLDSILNYDTYMEILDEEMTTHFQDKNFYQGIDAGIDKLVHYSKNQYEPPSLLVKIKKNRMEIIGMTALTLPFILGIIGFLLKNRRRN